MPTKHSYNLTVYDDTTCDSVVAQTWLICPMVFNLRGRAYARWTGNAATTICGMLTLHFHLPAHSPGMLGMRCSSSTINIATPSFGIELPAQTFQCKKQKCENLVFSHIPFPLFCLIISQIRIDGNGKRDQKQQANSILDKKPYYVTLLTNERW